MHETLYILLLGSAFSLSAKPIDLVDENKWITGVPGLVVKYFFVLAFSYVVFVSLQVDKNFTPYFLALFLFWILKGKFEYPSHVLFAFIPAVLMGQHITKEYVIMGLAGLAVYGVLEWLIRNVRNSLFQVVFYTSLARFLIVPLGFSVYLRDYNLFLYVVPGLLLMHCVRALVRKDIICVREGRRT